jgi:S1-C subfamily serine protease
LQRGDIILKVDGQTINTRSDFEEYLSYRYPGDEITVVYKRDNKIKSTTVELTNREGTTGIIKREVYHADDLGADLEVVPKVERELLQINHGIRVSNIQGGFIKELGIEEGFIITGINGKLANDPEELAGILQTIRGRVRIEGVNKKGVKGYYSYYF